MNSYTDMKPGLALPAAIIDALDRMGALREMKAAGVDASAEGLTKLVAEDLRDRGLQAEAGVAYNQKMILILHSSREPLNSGVLLVTYLTVTTDKAYWNVGVTGKCYGGKTYFIAAADVISRDDVSEMLRFAGGGSSVD